MLTRLHRGPTGVFKLLDRAVLILFLLISLPAFSAFAAESPLFSYTQRLWQMQDGLPEQVVQAFAQTIDLARVGKLAQHAIERGAVGVLGAKCARDLARANLAAALTDKGDKLLTGRQAGLFHQQFFGPFIGLDRRPISATSKIIRPLPWAACVRRAACRRRAFSTTL